MEVTRSDKGPSTSGSSKPDDSGDLPQTANQQPHTKSPAATSTTSPASGGGLNSRWGSFPRGLFEQIFSAAAPPTQQTTKEDSAGSLVRNSTRGDATASSTPGGPQSPGGRVYDKSPATSRVSNATASSDPLTPIAAAAGRNPKRANTSVLSSPPPYAVDDDDSPFEDTPKAGDAPGGFQPHNEDDIDYAGPNEYWSKSSRIDDSDQEYYEDAAQDSPSSSSSSFYGEPEAVSGVKKITRPGGAGFWDQVLRDAQSNIGQEVPNRVGRPVSYNGPKGGRAAFNRQGPLPDTPSVLDDVLPYALKNTHLYARGWHIPQSHTRRGGREGSDNKNTNSAAGTGIAEPCKSLAVIALSGDIAKDILSQFTEQWSDPSGNLAAPQIEAIYQIALPQMYANRFQDNIWAANALGGSKTRSTYYGGRYACDLAVHGESEICDSSSCSICLAIKTGFDKLELGKTEHVGVHGKGIYTNVNPYHAHRFTVKKRMHPFRAMILCRVIEATRYSSSGGQIGTVGLFDVTGRVYCKNKSTIIPRQLIIYSEPPDLRRAG